MTIPEALIKLSNSKFRGRFKLNNEMKEAVERSGLAKIRDFAELRVRENYEFYRTIKNDVSGMYSTAPISTEPERTRSLP